MSWTIPFTITNTCNNHKNCVIQVGGDVFYEFMFPFIQFSSVLLPLRLLASVVMNTTNCKYNNTGVV